MLEIKVNKGDLNVKGKGSPTTLLAELGMIVENVLEDILIDCPDDFIDCMKSVIKETMDFAIDEALNKN